MRDYEKPYIPLTIERQLELYSKCEEHTERHEVLWHEWNHNKRWLIQLQQLILPSFPSYSKHDVSHSEAVLHNIEMMLGEENVKQLSATDCFVILHTVYIHDIGMCITHDERKDILKNKKFQEFLMKLCDGNSEEMGYYASVLLGKDKENGEKYKNDIDTVLSRNLQVYYAIIYLISEFRRRSHGEVSQQRLLNWINEPDKLGVGFSTIEIPSRLFYIIANCASTHTKWEFQAVLDLNQEDTGFAYDYVHPRFVAVLLQLGDALDMDNDRFHPLTQAFMGNLPQSSMVHYGKHKAIRRMRINNEKISISADCQNQEEMRQIRRECDSIQEILKNATYYWAVIRPKNTNIGLPTFDQTVLLLKGKQVPPELVEARFEISQEKAFNLIEGNNIYKNEGLVFLRELLQNAIDATKRQYYQDCRRKKYLNDGDTGFKNPIELLQKVTPNEYPIEIKLSVKKSLNGKLEDITEKDLKNPKKLLQDCECGVLVEITDYATGISAEDIKMIANVGSSYERRKEEIEKMPQWLQPTANFGVGLQSAFLAGKKLVAETHTRKEEYYEITFYPRHHESEGYINVKPKQNPEDLTPYGTTFRIFVPSEKRRHHLDSPKTWDGADPFGEFYEENREIRHTNELVEQMGIYIKKIAGNLIFPLNVRMELVGSINVEKGDWLNEIRRSGNEVDIAKKEQSGKTICSWKIPTYMDHILENKHICTGMGDGEQGNVYFLDEDNVKIYIWNQKYQVYARFGTEGIAELKERIVNSKKDDIQNESKIYYKGMQVTKKNFRLDSNLLEYMDIQGTLEKDYLKLNRNGFSQKGYDYLEKVYFEVIKTAQEAIQYYGTQQAKEGGRDYMDELENKIKIKITKGQYEQAKTDLISVAAFTFYSMISQNNELYEDMAEKTDSRWGKLVGKISEYIKDNKNSDPCVKEFDDRLNRSTLFHLPVWKEPTGDKETFRGNEISIVDLVDRDRKFAIVSSRRSRRDNWSSYLIEITKVHKRIEEKLEKLRDCHKEQERKKLVADLDVLLEFLAKEGTEKDSWEFKGREDRKLQMFLKWLLVNTPTMAMYASSDSNKRINVLDMKVYGSVYLNRYMKVHIINSMLEKAEMGFERFSSMVWCGYSYLGLESPKVSVCFVKRGKLARAGYGEMIFPLTGNDMKKLQEKIEDEYKKAETEIINYYKKVSEPVINEIIKLLGKENSVNEQEEKKTKAIRRFLEYHFEFLKYSKTKPDNRADLTENEIQSIAKCFIEKRPEKIEIEMVGEETIKKLGYFVNELLTKLNDYDKMCPNHFLMDGLFSTGEFSRLVAYVSYESKMNSSEEHVKALYKSHMMEMQDALVEQHKRSFKLGLSREFPEYCDSLRAIKV